MLGAGRPAGVTARFAFGGRAGAAEGLRKGKKSVEWSKTVLRFYAPILKCLHIDILFRSIAEKKVMDGDFGLCQVFQGKS